VLRVVVLVSGRGSNLQAILDAIEDGRLAAKVTKVISDMPDAYALKRAERAGVPTCCVERRDHSSRADFETALADCAEEAEPDLIVLAGFMRVLGRGFLDRFSGKVINIHPSLLPSFRGLEAQRQALEAGVRYAGCTVHFVNLGVDSGPIIDQRVVPVLPEDDVETLSARILEQEHDLLVDVIRRFGAGLV
jgi:phosphoribosylglycinamide formyltransferase-1